MKRVHERGPPDLRERESHIGCRIMCLAARLGKAGRPLSFTGFLIVSLPAG
jgi:hypothetical protein